MRTDLARVLREFSLESLRRELRTAGARVLVAEDGCGLCRPSEGEPWDAVWLQLECLDGIEPASLARGTARALRPGGRLVTVVPGAWPLAGLLQRALRGRGEAPGALRSRLDAACARRLPFAAWRRAFEPAIAWRRSRAFGLLVPPAAVSSRLPPLSLAVLAAAEDVVGAWPLLRTLGEWIVHEGVRRWS
jgi:SAM-dependent methyltransferase